MSKEQDKQLYDTLRRTAELMTNVRPVEGEMYTLESILAEYGSGAAKPVPKPAKATEEPEERLNTAPVKSHKAPLSPKHTVRQDTVSPGKAPEPTQTSAADEQDAAPAPPDRVSLREVMRSTVDTALEENDDGILPPPVPLHEKLRSLLSLRRTHTVYDTEQLWDEPEEKSARKAAPPLPPEPDPDEAFRYEKRHSKHLRSRLTLAAIPTLLCVLFTLLEYLHLLPAAWTDSPLVCGAVPGALVFFSLLCCFDTAQQALRLIKLAHIGCEAASVLTALLTLLCCALYTVVPQANAPFAACACLSLCLCQWGLLLRAQARCDAFRPAAGSAPPYAASLTSSGACRQKGRLRGFYHLSDQPDAAAICQRFLVPLLLSVTLVLSCIVCLTKTDMTHFPWVWCAMLCASVPLSLPVCFTLPLRLVQKRLSRSGASLAGYAGAKSLAKVHRVILTEDDLFPAGTVEFNGYKVYGEERRKMLSYAASVAYAAKSSLYPLFAQQLDALGGYRTPVDELNFCDEGGVLCTLRGETVAMGSMYFMNRQHITLPRDIKLQTGVFLAVDGVLSAIFVIKYQPSRNVEWALRTLRRSRVTPVLAVRSGNVTPGLLKRKFGVDAKAIYPNVATRLALGDICTQTAKRPNALLYREGLMPLVEAVIGAKRLLSAARCAAFCTYFGGIAGVFLTYYFTSVGSFSTLSPLYMLGYALLCLLPALLLGNGAKHF